MTVGWRVAGCQGGYQGGGGCREKAKRGVAIGEEEGDGGCHDRRPREGGARVGKREGEDGVGK